MKWFYVLPMLAFANPASAQQQQQPEAEDGQTIVITGTPLSQTEKALRDCLARKCPPDEDINATLAHAENLFVAGDYQDARHVARASLRRNDGHAKAYPLPVSDLYRANSRISAHLGEGADYQRSTWGIKRALKAGLPGTDPRLVGADLEVAGMHAALGRIDSARRVYAEAEDDAMAINRPDLAATARVRMAWLHQLNGDTNMARRKLQEITQDRSAGAQVPRLTALVLLARIDRQQGRQASSDALIDELRGAGFPKPVLLFSPPMKLHTNAMAEGDSGSATRLMATDNFEDRWVDVGFWVTADGRVDDMEILRSAGPTSWAEPVLKSIRGRIYSPTAGDGTEGAYRIERYTYTSLWASRTGTRIRQRSQDARIEFLDLTAEPETRSN